ncbi:MAG: GTPase ObgE [Bdellovibrionales bacterium]|nr:GTPase ObgE [Bdellovibrionales bacterium]
MKFVDQIRIQLHSGHGGPGKVSFRRESGIPRGGPDGGDGGRGGHIVLRATRNTSSLYAYKGKKELRAPDGQPGDYQKMTGADGMDMIIEVPVGTMVKDLEGNLLADLPSEQDFILYEGGRGGKGNTFFKNSVNQAPMHAQPGEEGQGGEVIIEIKVIADVGIIGFPNAGKSTLVSAVTAARPIIADYPFTTLNPQLGVVVIDVERNFVIADIPGLIKGAHKGQGLGHKFLKHIERTRCFVHLLDVSEFSNRDVWQDFADINEELEKYDQVNAEYDWYKPLAKRPQVVVFNKVDATSPDRIEELEAMFRKKGVKEIIKISAATRLNLPQLVNKLTEIVFNKDL